MSEEFVVVGQSKYRVIKTGRAQAEQVVLLTKWISKHGVPALQAIQASGIAGQTTNNIEFLIKILDVLTADALVDLFQAATGCTPEEAEVYFDIATLIDVVIEVYQHQPAIQRLVDRFFSQPASEVANQPELSTTSGELTDGQTSKS